MAMRSNNAVQSVKASVVDETYGLLSDPSQTSASELITPYLAGLADFSGDPASIGSEGESVNQLVFSISGVKSDGSEKLLVANNEIALTSATNLMLAQGVFATVSLSYGEAVVEINGQWSQQQAEQLINSIQYKDTAISHNESDHVIKFVLSKSEDDVLNNELDLMNVDTNVGEVVKVVTINPQAAFLSLEGSDDIFADITGELPLLDINAGYGNKAVVSNLFGPDGQKSIAMFQKGVAIPLYSNISEDSMGTNTSYVAPSSFSTSNSAITDSFVPSQSSLDKITIRHHAITSSDFSETKPVSIIEKFTPDVMKEQPSYVDPSQLSTLDNGDISTTHMGIDVFASGRIVPGESMYSAPLGTLPDNNYAVAASDFSEIKSVSVGTGFVRGFTREAPHYMTSHHLNVLSVGSVNSVDISGRLFSSDNGIPINTLMYSNLHKNPIRKNYPMILSDFSGNKSMQNSLNKMKDVFTFSKTNEEVVFDSMIHQYASFAGDGVSQIKFLPSPTIDIHRIDFSQLGKKIFTQLAQVSESEAETMIYFNVISLVAVSFFMNNSFGHIDASNAIYLSGEENHSQAGVITMDAHNNPFMMAPTPAETDYFYGTNGGDLFTSNDNSLLNTSDTISYNFLSSEDHLAADIFNHSIATATDVLQADDYSTVTVGVHDVFSMDDLFTSSVILLGDSVNVEASHDVWQWFVDTSDYSYNQANAYIYYPSTVYDYIDYADYSADTFLNSMLLH